MNMTQKLKKEFIQYVLQNTAGMVGISVYILADTFFISLAAGPDGITVLNLALPVYGILFALGSMVGIGSATRFALLRAGRAPDSDSYFANSLAWNLIFSVPFVLFGLFSPESIVQLMGGDTRMVSLGKDYFRIFLLFAPLFQMNYTFSAFVRNDRAPTRAMLATLSGSIFNIIFDYVFMFVCHMGLAGAALATAIAPGLSILINLFHFFEKKCTIRFRPVVPSITKLIRSCPLGVGAFIGELSSAVTTTVFNYLILGLVGNIGIAAYGIIANLALVAMAIFNGISQGTQPLLSREYGEGNSSGVRTLLRYSLLTTFGTALVLVVASFLFTDPFVAIFNSTKNAALRVYAFWGLRLYFLGFLIAGIDIMLIAYYAAIDNARISFLASILRGVVAICACSVLLAKYFGLTGVWLSFAASELITLAVLLFFFKSARK